MKPVIQTYSGVFFDLLNPRPEDVRIEDIAHALSLIARYNGHTKGLYCVGPETKVLTGDLEWVQAGDLVEGQELVGFDEHSPKSRRRDRRKLRRSVVEKHDLFRKQGIEICLSDGSVLRCSEEHLWVVSTKASRNFKWKTASDLLKDFRKGRVRWFPRFFPTWKGLQTWDAGYVAGMLDGEGSLSMRCDAKPGDSRLFSLQVSQKENGALRRLKGCLEDRRIPHGESLSPASQVFHLSFLGGHQQVCRVLGEYRPSRLLDKFREGLRTGGFDREMRTLELVKVEEVRELGSIEVAGMRTSTRTFFAEGFGSHNSVAQHSVHVSQILPPEYQMSGLMHDAAEAYVGDITSPLKYQVPRIKEIEQNIHDVICDALGIAKGKPQKVHDADMLLLVTEARDLMGAEEGNPYWTFEGYRPLAMEIVPLFHIVAEDMFLTRYHELKKREELLQA